MSSASRRAVEASGGSGLQALGGLTALSRHQELGRLGVHRLLRGEVAQGPDDEVRPRLGERLPVALGGVPQQPRRAFGELSAAAGDFRHPLIEEREEKKVTLLAIASNRGLCGGYNSNVGKEAHCRAVERAKEYILAGDIFQVVLSQRFRLPLGDTDVFDVYRAMRIINPSPYMYFLRLPDRIVAGASPETLVRLEDGEAAGRPIAGTRHRGRDEAEDQALAEDLLARLDVAVDHDRARADDGQELTGL